MALEFVPDVRAGTGPVDTWTADRHLYLTEDKTRVVEEGHPDSRWLWASPGTEVPRAEAIRLGAVKPEPEPAAAANDEQASGTEETSGVATALAAEEESVAAESTGPEPAEQSEAKARKAAPNKARKQAPNKAASPAEGE